MDWQLFFEKPELQKEVEFSEVCILGAGASGLSALSTLLLKQPGYPKPDATLSSSDQLHPWIRIFDKGRGLGGRIATRRTLAALFDHGALAFNQLEQVPADLVDVFRFHQLSRATHMLKSEFVESDGSASPVWHQKGQTTWCKDLLATLSSFKTQYALSLDRKIMQIMPQHAPHSMDSNAHEQVICRELLLTCPLPQAAELIERSLQRDLGPKQKTILNEALDHVQSLAKEVRYAPRLVNLIRAPNDLDFSNLIGHPEISQIARYAASEDSGCFTIQWSTDFSERHFDRPDEDILQICLSSLNSILNVSLSPDSLELKKWRYGLVTQVAKAPATGAPRFAVQLSEGLWIAGDGLAGPAVGHALQSGYEAGLKILASIESRFSGAT